MQSPTLPSSQHAYEVVTGQPNAWWHVAGDIVERAALIAVGIGAYDLATRMRLDRRTIPYSLVGAIVIEMFVLNYTRNQVTV